MKKLNKVSKSIVLSTIAALAFGGIALTTTYALFTSEATTDVSVSTGKVKVTSIVTVEKVYSPKSINTDGTIDDDTNNTDADINAVVSGSDVTITKMLPGDSVTLKIAPENESTVNIKYRETYTLSGDYQDLTITGNDKMVTKWTSLVAGGSIDAYEITISLPTTATKEIDEATISFGVEAVQGNALVYDDIYADTLEEAFNLSDISFGYNSSNSNPVNLDGHGHVFINKWVDDYISSDTTIKGVTFLNGATFTTSKDSVTLTFEDCTFYACDQSKLVYTSNNSITNSGAGMCLDIEKQSKQNVSYTIKGCKFIGENDSSLPAYGNKYDSNGNVSDAYKKRGYGIALSAIAGKDNGGTLKDVLIEDCEITGVRGNAIQLHGDNGNITIKDTKINSWGVNSGAYTLADGTTKKDGNSAAIRGDYGSGTRTLNLENVYFGLDEGTGVNGNIITHVYVGSYLGNTSTDDTGTRIKGTYSFADIETITYPTGVASANFPTNNDACYVDGSGVVQYVADLNSAINKGASIIYCKKGATLKVSNTGTNRTSDITSDLTIYANGANFSYGEIGLNVGTTGQESDFTINIYDAKNLTVWGIAPKTGHKQNVIFTNCTYVGQGRNVDGSRMHFILGTDGSTDGEMNVTVDNCHISKCGAGVYQKANGSVVVKNSTFDSCAAGMKISHKLSGTCTVNVSDTTFTSCGATQGESQYNDRGSIKCKSAGTMNINLSNVTINNVIGDYSVRIGKNDDDGASEYNGTYNVTAQNVLVDGNAWTYSNN